MKTCTRCGAEKELSCFFKRSRSVDGYQPCCKDCSKKYASAYYEEKSTELLAQKKEYYVRHKDRIIAYNADRYATKKDEALAWMAGYYKRNREARLAYQKAVAPETRKRFKDRMNAYAAEYRAAKHNATPGWADREKIAEFYQAADFLSMVTGEWYHVDHIVPLQSKLVCGLHCESNLQVLPGSENQAKGNRHWPDMP
jgi:hypothetical protein